MMAITRKQLPGATVLAVLSVLAGSLSSAQAPSSAVAPSFAAVVGLQYSRDRVLCSGVIVTDQQVLTAAHCVCDEIPLYAFVGKTFFPTTDGPGWQQRLSVNLSKVSFMVPGFCERYRKDPLKTAASGDLALIFLEDRLPRWLIDLIQSEAAVSRGDQKFTDVIVVGWGESDNFWRPGRKKFTSVKLTARLCSEMEEVTLGCKAGQEALAGDPPGDTCFADSGGGLYGRDMTGSLHLVAITSRASKPTKNNLCGMGGIYTSLESPAIRSWLTAELAATYKRSVEHR